MTCQTHGYKVVDCFRRPCWDALLWKRQPGAEAPSYFQESLRDSTLRHVFVFVKTASRVTIPYLNYPATPASD